MYPKLSLSLVTFRGVIGEAPRRQAGHMWPRLSPLLPRLRGSYTFPDAYHGRPVLRYIAVMDMAQMQKAIVKSLPGEPNLTITLNLAGKLRNLDRPKTEPLEKPLSRIHKSAAPQPDKRQRRSQQKGAAAGNGPSRPQQQQQQQQQQLSTASSAAALPVADPAGGLERGRGADSFVTLHAGPSSSSPPLDPLAVTNVDAWQQGRLLRVGGEFFKVELNPPLIDRLDIPPGVFVGIPVYPLLTGHFLEARACLWRWLRRGSGGGWQEIPGATQRVYVPQEEDAGCTLRVECTPARSRCLPSDLQQSTAAGAADAAAMAEEGELCLGEASATSCGPVARPPSPLGAQPRLALTQHRAQAPEFRVVSYNILADQYAGTDTAKKVLFKHCPPECLLPEYRRPLLLAELLGLRGDVVALQEVDEKMFNQVLEPQLGNEGYGGAYTNKAGKVREGEALFWRKDRFALVDKRDITLKDFFPAPPSPLSPSASRYLDVFEPMLRSSPHLTHALQRVGTVAQLVLLTPVGGQAGGDAPPHSRPLLLANTHLFFHYQASHIRTMHTWVIMQEAQRFIEEAMADPSVRSRLGGQRPTLLFCGDLNSDLNDGIPGAVELLGKGKLPWDHWDWEWGADFKWGGEGEEGGDTSGAEFGEVSKMVQGGSGEHAHPSGTRGGVVPGVDLSLPFQLASADGLRTPFTNYVKGYQGLLDYVWYDPQEVEVSREFPPPSTPGELGGFLPSRTFPSDHLPVVFDLRFKAQQGAAGSGGGGSGGGNSSTRGRGDGGTGNDAGGRGEGRGEVGGGSGGAKGGSSGGGGGGAGDGGNLLQAAFHNVGAAVGAVQGGRVVALPTDTLYGLASCATSTQGVAAIYSIKRRKLDKPLAICVADPGDVQRYGEVEHLPRGLVEELLPGPVTLLLGRRRDAPLSPRLNPGVDAIGIRVPDAGFIRAVCRQHRGALALTSANISQGLSPQRVQEFEELWPLCAAVFDGGELGAGRAGSTVIDLTDEGMFRITRRGSGFAEVVHLLTERYGLQHQVAP